MTTDIQTSSHFACATASGADWREVGRKLLEGLEAIRTPDDGMTIGFLYATDAMASDAGSLLTLMKNVTRIQHWYGATGKGICGNGVSHVDVPAAVAMIGRFAPGSFHGFSVAETAPEIPPALKVWMQTRTPALTPLTAITHGVLGAPAAGMLGALREREGVYAVGGFSGAQIQGKTGGVHLTDGSICRDGEPLSGVVLDTVHTVMAAASWGCVPAGAAGRITRCIGHVIETIDDMPAYAFLHRAIDALPDTITTGPQARTGHVHAAFPVAGDDRAPLLVRNITSTDDPPGSITVAHHFQRGDTIQFIYRDGTTTAEELSRTLTGLYARAAAEAGAANLKPKALLYFGCGARAPDMPGRQDDEAALIATVFGGVPMAGFYTAAEIANGHVYGYTGVIVLFL